MNLNDRIRISDSDRDRAAAQLRDYYAEGRLTNEELDERVTAALQAQTAGDLRRLMADLPSPVRPPAGRGPRRTERGRTGRRRGRAGTGAADAGHGCCRSCCCSW